MSNILKFLQCGYCGDIILLRDKVKCCECGACVGARTGDNLYTHSGKISTTFQIEAESLKQPEGGKFIGFISRREPRLGSDTRVQSGVIVVKAKPYIEIL